MSDEHTIARSRRSRTSATTATGTRTKSCTLRTNPGRLDSTEVEHIVPTATAAAIGPNAGSTARGSQARPVASSNAAASTSATLATSPGPIWRPGPNTGEPDGTPTLRTAAGTSLLGRLHAARAARAAHAGRVPQPRPPGRAGVAARARDGRSPWDGCIGRDVPDKAKAGAQSLIRRLCTP